MKTAFFAHKSLPQHYSTPHRTLPATTAAYPLDTLLVKNAAQSAAKHVKGLHCKLWSQDLPAFTRGSRCCGRFPLCANRHSGKNRHGRQERNDSQRVPLQIQAHAADSLCCRISLANHLKQQQRTPDHGVFPLEHPHGDKHEFIYWHDRPRGSDSLFGDWKLMAEQNAYAVLNIHKGSNDSEIKQAYVSLVKKFSPENHPDRFRVIQQAYEKLQDPEKRAKEDAFTYNFLQGDFNWAEDEKVEADEAEVEDRIRKIQEGIEQGNDDPDARQKLIHNLQLLSFQHAQKKQWTEAIGTWLTLLKIDQTHQRAKNNLINAYRHLGYYYALHDLHDEAVRMWENALKMDPDSTETIHNLALASEKMEDNQRSQRYWGETIKRWKELLAADPANQYLQQCLVEVHRHHGGRALERVQTPETKEEAIESYRSVLRLNPDDFDAQYNLAAALMEERNFEEAIQLLKKLQAENPRNLDIVNQLGWAYLNSGKFELAFNTWRRGMTVDPQAYTIRDSVTRARMAVGKKLKDNGHYTQALVHFKELIKLMPDAWEVYLEIADTMLRKGDRRSALAAFQKVLEYDPKNKQAKRAISDIRMRS